MSHQNDLAKTTVVVHEITDKRILLEVKLTPEPDPTLAALKAFMRDDLDQPDAQQRALDLIKSLTGAP